MLKQNVCRNTYEGSLAVVLSTNNGQTSDKTLCCLITKLDKVKVLLSDYDIGADLWLHILHRSTHAKYKVRCNPFQLSMKS